MQTRFLKPAEAEIDEAIAYFDEQREGLGDRFEQDLSDTVKLLTEYPLNRKVAHKAGSQVSSAHVPVQRDLCRRW